MALNQTHLLPGFDDVLVLDQGSLRARGSPQDTGAAVEALGLAGSGSGGGGTVDEMPNTDVAADAGKGDGDDDHTAREDEDGLWRQVSGDKEGQDEYVRQQSGNGKTGKKAANAAAASAPSGGAASEAPPAITRRGSVLAASAAAPEPEARDPEDRRELSAEEMRKASRVIKMEKRKTGAIGGSILVRLVKAQGLHIFGSFIVTIVGCYAIMGVADRWLAYWVKQDGSGQVEEGENIIYAAVYSAGSAVHAALMIISSLIFAAGATRASKKLHEDCLTRILKAPMGWFESVPSGRIISRFSADLSMVDLQMNEQLSNLAHQVFLLIAYYIMIINILPVLLPIMPVLGYVYFWAARALDRTMREVKRMRDRTLAPILSNLAETIQARSLSRHDLHARQFFLRRHLVNTDRYDHKLFTQSALQGCSILFAYYCSAVFVATFASAVYLKPDLVTPEVVGLAIAYMFLSAQMMGWFAQGTMMVNMALSSLERLLELTTEEVTQENPFELPEIDDGLKHRNWPRSGHLQFEQVSMRYRPDLPNRSLHNLSLDVTSGERVGIVGRTGAGKSTIMVVLFRLVELEEGRILLDGVDTSTVGLRTLRQRLGMIPQEAMLLRGSVRENLDPWAAYTDETLQLSLEKAGLGKMQLTDEVADAGGESRMSAGEGQLLSFARCLLAPKAVVLLDEPTANIDQGTDEVIQEILREALAGSTILCIAHRLITVIDFDKILVMDTGRKAEFGHRNVLSNPRHPFLDVGGNSRRAQISAAEGMKFGSGFTWNSAKIHGRLPRIQGRTQAGYEELLAGISEFCKFNAVPYIGVV